MADVQVGPEGVEDWPWIVFAAELNSSWALCAVDLSVYSKIGTIAIIAGLCGFDRLTQATLSHHVILGRYAGSCASQNWANMGSDAPSVLEEALQDVCTLVGH